MWIKTRYQLTPEEVDFKQETINNNNATEDLSSFFNSFMVNYSLSKCLTHVRHGRKEGLFQGKSMKDY